MDVLCSLLHWRFVQSMLCKSFTGAVYKYYSILYEYFDIICTYTVYPMEPCIQRWAGSTVKYILNKYPGWGSHFEFYLRSVSDKTEMTGQASGADTAGAPKLDAWTAAVIFNRASCNTYTVSRAWNSGHCYDVMEERTAAVIFNRASCNIL